MKSIKFMSLPFAVATLLALSLSPLSCSDDDDEIADSTSESVWLDPETELTWQAAVSCDRSFSRSRDYCDALDWGGSKDWRLPSISELRTLVRGCPQSETGGDCGITDECLAPDCPWEECGICEEGSGPNQGCYGPEELPDECTRLWSSSAVTDGEGTAFGLFFDVAYVAIGLDMSEKHCARCVR